MPTARELLAQADALMRRNRAEPPPPVAVDVPELTDALPPDATPVVDLRAPPTTLDDVPELTDAVEEIEAPSILELPGADDEPSRWLEIDRGEVSITGPAPDSIVVVPGLRPAAVPATGRVAAPPSASAAPAAAEAASAQAAAEAAAVDAWFAGSPNAGVGPAEPPSAPAAGASLVVPEPTFDDAAFAAAIGIDAATPAIAAPAAPPAPAPAAGFEWKDEALDALPDAAPAAEDALLRDGEGMLPAVADADVDILYDAAIDVTDVAGPAVGDADVVPPEVAAPEFAATELAAAELAATERSAPELAAPELAAAEPAAPVSLAAAAAPGAAAPLDLERWTALAEEIRMQVLQRIDIFTDTGLQAQLAARLQPIVDRASADLVATINQQVGQLLRAYVAEAIEREIDQWRRGG